MGPLLTSYFLVLASICGGAMLGALAFNVRVVFKITLLWVLIISVAWFTNMWVIIISVIIGALFLKNYPVENKVIFFIALLPALPVQTFNIPFPGINFLWDISYVRLLIVTLLLPSFVTYFRAFLRGRDRLNKVDIVFIVFVGLLMLLEFRGESFTNALRNIFSLFIDYIVPYFVLSRYLRTTSAIAWALMALFLSACVVSLIGILESHFSWRLFTVPLESLSLNYDIMTVVPAGRDGVTRATGGAMLDPLSFAFFLALAIMTCILFVQKRMVSLFPALLVLCVFLYAIYLTQSRGGQLSLIVGVSVLYFFWLNGFTRLLLIGLFLILFSYILEQLTTGGFTIFDSQGTFQYRYDLILNSMDAVSRNWFLGSIDYIDNQQLQQSRQGQGIIDVVNVYLQVLLYSGVVGLFFYVGVFFTLIWGISSKPNVEGLDLKHYLLAVLILTMCFILTCSNISFVPWYVLLFWSIARAYLDIEPNVERR